VDINPIIGNLSRPEDSFDIYKLIAAIRRRFGLFLTTLILVTSLVTLFTLQTQPRYTATASVMIDVQEANLINLEAAFRGEAQDSSAIDTEVEIFRSRTLGNKVVTRLNLLADPEFNRELREAGTMDRLKSGISTFFPNQIPERPAAESDDKRLLDNVTASVLENLNVYRHNNTYVLNLEFTSTSSKKAAEIVNAFADNYLLEQLETKFESTSRTNDWLNDRLNELKSEVRASENAVEIYRSNSGLLSAQGSSLTEQQISDLNAQKIVETSAYDEVKARLDSVNSQMARGVPADTISEVMGSSVIRDLRRQEAEVAGRRAELSSRYGPRHPDVLEVDREAADIQIQIEQEVNRVVSSLESEVGIAQQKVRTIDQNLGQMRSELSNNNRSLVRLRELEREAEASRTLYQSFLEQFKQIDDQEEITEADARVISAAVIPIRPSSPKTTFNLIVGLLLGTVMGFGAAVLAELLDQGLSTGADVEREIGVSFISSIPELDGGIIGFFRRLFSRNADDKVIEYVNKNPFSVFAESFRMLRSTILLSTPEKPPKVVVIASALPNEGKTTVVKAIGRMSAMSGSRTLIMDCDLRLQQLSKSSRVTPKAGIIKYLKGDAKLNEIIAKDDSLDCDYILNLEDEYTNKDLFGTETFTKLLNTLRRRYDLIILDTPPVLLVSETLTLAQKADCVVMATRWRRTRINAVKMAVASLRKVDSNIIGLVLTRVNLNKRHKYGVGDYSYYARQYGKYYSDFAKNSQTNS